MNDKKHFMVWQYKHHQPKPMVAYGLGPSTAALAYAVAVCDMTRLTVFTEDQITMDLVVVSEEGRGQPTRHYVTISVAERIVDFDHDHEEKT